MAAEPSGRALTHDADSTALGVLQSAVGLARAEARLVLLRAQAFFVGALVTLLGTLVAVSFVALALMLVTLSPVFSAARTPGPLSAEALFVSLGVSLCLALGGVVVAWLGWRRVARRPWTQNHGGEA